jgi:ketopantoate hydroxymethyltransferase
MEKAVIEYKQDVIKGKFPAAEHSFTIKEEELNKIKDSP